MPNQNWLAGLGLRVTKNFIDFTKALRIDGVAMNATAAELNQLDLSAVGAQLKLKKLPVTRVASTSEQDTGFDLPTKGIVLDVWVEVTTVEATGTTKTIDVGLLSSESGGDTDGFIDGVSVASTTGMKQAVLTKGAETVGVLMKYTITDNGTATHPQRQWHVLNGTAKSVVYALGSNNFAELVANIYILYIEIG